MSVKVALTVSCAALAALACAQISTKEQAIQDAFASLRSADSLVLQLQGSDKQGSRNDSLDTTVFWSWDSALDKFAKIDVWVNQNSARMARLCGDGITFWALDFRQNAYNSTRYGTYNAAPPTGFRSNLLQAVTNSSRGTTTWATRMLREIFSGTGAEYRTWLPGARITLLSTDPGADQLSMIDPVANRTYTASNTEKFIVYSYDTGLRRSAAFHFSRTDTASPYELTEVYVADQRTAGSTSRLIDFSIQVNPALATTTNYVFVPPTTARAIANPRPAGG